jgi:hypothetical protein
MLSTAGHWNQSSAAMLELLRSRFGQHVVAVTRAQAAARSPSIRLNQPVIWFQLAKMRLTTFQRKRRDFAGRFQLSLELTAN